MPLQREVMKKLRTEKNLSQEALCQDIYPRSTYASFESNGFSILSDTLFLLLDRLNVSVQEFQYLIQEGPLPKKSAYHDLIPAIEGKDQQALLALASEFEVAYQKNKDLGWLMLQLLAEYGYERLQDDYTVTHFKITHFKKIDLLIHHLETCDTWYSFEIAAFTNMMQFINATTFNLMIAELPQRLDLNNPDNQLSYLKVIINSAIYLLENEAYELVNETLAIADPYVRTHERLHYRILIRYYSTLTDELLNGRKSVTQYKFLKIYQEMGFEGLDRTLMNQRRRLLNEQATTR